jgi:Uma2 family endonuclease
MATAAPPDKLMTAEDLLAMGPDFHGQLVRGRLVEMAPASWGHGISGSKALLLIGGFVEANGLGAVFTTETGFRLSDDPDTVRAPDVAIVASARVPKTDDRSGFFNGSPDLAVEIVSPHHAFSDVAEKVDDYLNAGARQVWVIDDRRKAVTIYAKDAAPLTLAASDDATVPGGDVLPGFAVAVKRFFE